MRSFHSAVALALTLLLAGCGIPRPEQPGSAPGRPAPKPRGPAADTPVKIGKPYQVAGIWYYPSDDGGYDEVGLASWYGAQFHGGQTANGEVFDMDRVGAAHKTLPLPCYVEVTALDTGRTILVRINDRG
ncbi:MAG: septal ring lytic transglycosylase RlpA family protein, partial [Sphingomonadales bacterium]